MIRRACWLLVPLLVGCNNSGSSGGEVPSASSPAAVASAPASAAPVASTSAAASASGHGDHRGPGGGGGLSGMFFSAARGLGLPADVTAKIDAAQAPLRGDDPGDSMKTLHTDLVAQVRAGKIDQTKITADETAAQAAMKAHDDKEAAALNALHDALTPDQRKSLVDSIKAKQAERDAREAQMTRPDAGAPNAADWQKKRVDQMTASLGLDADQQKQATTIFAKETPPSPTQMQAMRDAMKAKVTAALTAFGADTFDAKKLEPFQNDAPMKTMLDQHVAMLSQLLPVLHPDQREKLAQQMERMQGGMMPGGMGAMPWGRSPFPDHEDGEHGGHGDHGGGGGGGGGGGDHGPH